MLTTKLVALCLLFYCIMVAVDELVNAKPSFYTNYENMRDLYELLLRNEALPPVAQFTHQMERKGGRSPSLRLRFGKRADLFWPPYFLAEAVDEPEI
ncbi:short neuropeptide F-like [Tachypleus tridentatus]|uniref:short neuropeptide F-like n=1 Tax=Tachypleus tridentatus TaxID=6853 RepID=UPI003FCEF896